MFLDLLNRRNPALLEAAVQLHQEAKLPANTYVLDLDAIEHNAKTVATEAKRLGLTVFAMTKQLARNADACHAIVRGGIEAAVAVDMNDARAVVAAGMKLGHLGHLVQVPRGEAEAGALLAPEFWTVFSDTKAAEAGAAAKAAGRDQALLARLQATGDEFYSGHEGGFSADDVLRVADSFDALETAHFAGVTTFPALLFDSETRTVRSTHNLVTLEKAATVLAASGRDAIQINGPGTTSTAALAALASAGVTQVEPGHALTGTTPWHATEDLPEIPAACYLSEISHTYSGRAYCFGGGTYIDPVFPHYQVRALVGADPQKLTAMNATMPPCEAIDYYAQLDLTDRPTPSSGDSVVFGFRIQAFVTRSYTAGVRGISTGAPHVEGIYDATGSPVSWPA